MKLLSTLLLILCGTIACAQQQIQIYTGGLPDAVISDPVGQSSPTGMVVESDFVEQRSGTVDSCGVDSVRYLMSKATDNEWYYLADTTFNNGGNVHDYYSKYAQYFDGSDSLYVHGACFYGFVFSVGDSAEVTVSIYNPATDSMPASLISQTNVWVYDDFSPTDINVSRVCVNFDSVVTVHGPYLIALETATTQELLVMSNSFTNLDGQNEHLSYAYYSNPDYPSFHGWYDQTDFAANWDFDWIIEPNVSFPIDAEFTLSTSSMCEGDTVCLTNISSDTNYRSRMYNQDAPYAGITYDWGDGAISNGSLSDCHIYSIAGNYTITHIENVNGWTTSCSVSHTEMLNVDPLPNASFTHVDNLGGSITFADMSSNADSVLWDLGDGTTTTDSAFNYVYSQTGSSYNVTLIAYNDCGSDTTTLTIVPDPTSVSSLSQDQFKLYPVPATDVLSIENTSGEILNFKVLDSQGRIVLSNKLRNRVDLNVQTLSAGVYTIVFNADHGQTSKRFVVNR